MSGWRFQFKKPWSVGITIPDICKKIRNVRNHQPDVDLFQETWHSSIPTGILPQKKTIFEQMDFFPALIPFEAMEIGGVSGYSI